MKFADPVRNKTYETEGSSEEDDDRKVSELQVKYKLSDKERSALVNETGSSLKGAGGGGRRRGCVIKKFLKFSIKLMTLGFSDDK